MVAWGEAWAWAWALAWGEAAGTTHLTGLRGRGQEEGNKEIWLQLLTLQSVPAIGELPATCLFLQSKQVHSPQSTVHSLQSTLNILQSAVNRLKSTL